MMIEITGGHSQNKGAQLMLLTTVRELSARLPKSQYCCPAVGPYEARAAGGLWQTFPKRKAEGYLRTALELKWNSLLASFVRRNSRQRYGLVAPWETDGLVDISGSQFSDAWPVKRIEGFAQLMGDYQRRDKPVILLPQMFGKFPTERSRAAMRRAIANCTLAYARDRDSLVMLEECAGKQDKIRLAPDITIFSPYTPPPEDFQSSRPYACIVPNARMLDQGAAHWGPIYMPRLEQVIKLLAARGIHCLLTLHDTKGQDLKLCEQLLAKLPAGTCEMLDEPDPFKLKGILSRARLLVASRYHSIVGALSTGVPVITLGWAHKYPGLLADFGVPELIHNHDQPEQHLLGLIEQLLDDAHHREVSQRLRESKVRMSDSSQQMWQDVARVIAK